jgi:hypothetical protein
MNQIAEDQTSDDEISSPLTVVEKRKSEFVRPAYSFKGNQLFPFTYGYELLFNQVRDAEDTGLFTWLAFVYLLRKHEPDETEEHHRKWAIQLAWKVEEFRTSLSIWMDIHGPFTNQDKLDAKLIYEENMKAIADTTVEAVPDRKSAQKKTSRQKKESSSTSSEGS